MNRFGGGLILLLSVIVACLLASWKIKTIEVSVFDGDGVPIESADVLIVRLSCRPAETPDHSTTMQTNSQGILFYFGRACSGFRIQVSKEGYFPSRVINPGQSSHHDVSVVMRKRHDSQPLYAKRAKIAFIEANRWFDYDFRVGDVVAPYGSGSVTMVKMMLVDPGYDELEREHSESARLVIAFGGSNDGAIVVDRDSRWEYSSVRLVVEAPREGYMDTLDVWKSPGNDSNLERNTYVDYIVRTECEKDSKAGEKEQLSCTYARISHLSFMGLRKGIEFEYVYNPQPGSRDLEYDCRKNLFTDLSHDESKLDC